MQAETDSAPSIERPTQSAWDMLWRVTAGAQIVLWLGVLVMLAWGNPIFPAVLGIAWAVLGAAFPRIFLLSLAALLPLFGNNPGGPHALYVLEMGVMGYVVRGMTIRLVGLAAVRSSPLDGLLAAFVACSTLALAPQARHLICEAYVSSIEVGYPPGFVTNIYHHFVNAPVFGARLWFDLVLSVGFFAALRDSPPPPRTRRAVGAVLLAGLAVASLAGLADYFKIISLEFWRGENPYITAFNFRRLQSLFWHSGWFAQYVALLAPAALVMALFRPGNEKALAPRRAGWIALAALFGVTQLLTMQRGGWIALAAGYGVVVGAVIVGSGSSNRRRLALGSAGGVGVAAFAVIALAALIPAFRDRLGELTRLEHRFEIWAAAWGLIKMFPASGIGLGNYATLHRLMYLPPHEAANIIDKGTAHSTYLHILTERGAIGFIIFALWFLGALWLIGRAYLRATRSESSIEERREILAIGSGLAALAAYGVFQYVFYIRSVGLLFWLMLGLATIHMPHDWALGVDRRSSRAKRSAWFIGSIAMLGFLASAQTRSFVPWVVWGNDGLQYRAGGQQVRLAAPNDFDRVAIPLYCDNPNPDAYPIEFIVSFEGGELGRVAFEAQGPALARVELPSPRDPKSTLDITASVSWRPYGYVNRDTPLLDSGVHYGAFREAAAP